MRGDQDELAAIVARIFEATYSPTIHRGLTEREGMLAPELGRLDDGWIESIVPFLEQALATAAKPEPAKPPSDRVIEPTDELPLALAVVARDLRLIRGTARAHRLLRRASLLSLSFGRVVAHEGRRQRELAGVVERVVDDGMSRALSWSDAGGVTQEFLCVRMPSEGGDAAALIVMNVEIGSFENFRRTLEQVHGLTPSEAEVAARLAQGRSIDEIAATKGTSANTVRTQVKQAFAKTGTSRQGELIALVLNGPAAWLRLVDDPQTSAEAPAARVHRSPEGSGVLELEDGRALSYGDYGPESGRPVVVCHHLLGSRHDAPGDPELLDRLQVRLIVPERPGIGGSSPVEKRSLMGWARDLGQLVDALALDRFHALGLSSGGPHAAACAALLPDRVIGVGMAASLMPWDDLPPGTPVDLTQRFLVGMSRRWPAGVRSLLVRRYRAQLDRPDAALAALVSRGNAADAALFEAPDMARLRLRDLHSAARVPPEVFADELVTLFRPWQFSLRDLRVPIRIWHGRLDDFFSCDQTEAMSAGLRDCRIALEEGWGHFFFYHHWERLLRELLELGADA